MSAHRRVLPAVAVAVSLTVVDDPSLARASTWCGGEPPARVVVDASELGTLSPAALDEIAEGATTAVRDRGLSPDQVKVTLVVIDHLEAIRGVRVSIVTPTVALTSDDGDPRGPIVARCTACAEDELMTLSTEGVLTALAQLDDLRAAPRVEPKLEDEPAPAPVLPTATEPSPRSLRWPGVVMLAVGGGSVVTGVVLVGLGRPPPDIETAQDVLRDYRTPGFAVLGVGVALAVTGAVLVGVERTRARRGRAVAVRPTAGGVVMTGRF